MYFFLSFFSHLIITMMHLFCYVLLLLTKQKSLVDKNNIELGIKGDNRVLGEI